MPDDIAISPNFIPEISDSDIYEAMEEIPGYLDITPEDFREIYRHAFQHAYQKQFGGRYVSRPEPVCASPEAVPIYAGSVSDAPAVSFLKNYFGKMRGPTEARPHQGCRKSAGRG